MDCDVGARAAASSPATMYNLRRLASADFIGTTNLWTSLGGTLAYYYDADDDSFGYGEFLGMRGYVGLEMERNGNLHYGWADVEVHSQAAWLTIHGYAYQQQPNTGLLAGERTLTAPTADATNGWIEAGIDWLSFGFSPGSGSKRIIVAREGAPVDWTPTNGIIYLGVTNRFPDAPDVGSGHRIVFDGRAYGSSVTGLTPGTTYHLAVYEYHLPNGLPLYRTAGVPLRASATTETSHRIRILPTITPYFNLSMPNRHGFTYQLLHTTNLSLPFVPVATWPASSYPVSYWSGTNAPRSSFFRVQGHP